MIIKADDVKALGKVLRRLSDLCEREPQRVAELLSLDKRKEHRNDLVGLDAELDRLDLFELAKGKSRDELMTFFRQHTPEQLRYLARRYRFGVLKKKSWQPLAEHLVDQILKRKVDVFKTHE